MIAMTGSSRQSGKEKRAISFEFQWRCQQRLQYSYLLDSGGKVDFSAASDWRFAARSFCFMSLHITSISACFKVLPYSSRPGIRELNAKAYVKIDPGNGLATKCVEIPPKLALLIHLQRTSNRAEGFSQQQRTPFVSEIEVIAVAVSGSCGWF